MTVCVLAIADCKAFDTALLVDASAFIKSVPLDADASISTQSVTVCGLASSVSAECVIEFVILHTLASTTSHHLCQLTNCMVH